MAINIDNSDKGVKDREKLETGKSVYQHIVDNNKYNLTGISQSYYGAKSTFAEDFAKIDVFARSINKLNKNQDSTVAFSTLSHPSNLIGFMAQNKQGKRASFLNPVVIRNYPELALDRLETETIFMSETFYHTAKDGIAKSNVKNIVIIPLSEGAENLKELVADIRQKEGGKLKFLPASLIIKTLKKGYKNIKKADRIPGVSYYNYDEFIALSDGDESLVLNNPRPDRITLYQHTSGTTGEPKIVPKSDDTFTLSHNAYLSIEGINWDIDDRNGNYYPLFPTTMFQSVLSSWAMGAEQLTNPLVAFNEGFAKNVYDNKVTTCTATTQAYRTFLTIDLPNGSMPFFVNPIGGGEYIEKRVANELNQRFRELGMPNRFIIGYGASEMHPGTHLEVVPFYAGSYNSVRDNVAGHSIGSVKTRIVGLDGKKLPKGKRGLVEIKPDSKPFPYIGREKEWEEKWTADGFYKTHDVGLLYEDGRLDVHGRHSDRFIDNEGNTHYLFDINRIVNENETILRATPVFLDNSVKSELNNVVVFIQLKQKYKDEAEKVLRDVVSQVETELEPGARPIAYRFVDIFPIGNSLKTDLKILSRQNTGFYNIEKNKIIEISFVERGEVGKEQSKSIRTDLKLL